jgi:hypothetical protein
MAKIKQKTLNLTNYVLGKELC